jgi:hypothetical protein
VNEVGGRTNEARRPAKGLDRRTTRRRRHDTRVIIEEKKECGRQGSLDGDKRHADLGRRLKERKGRGMKKTRGRGIRATRGGSIITR